MQVHVIDVLVQVPWISFVGKGGEEGQIVRDVACIDINNICLGVVDGGNHIKGGA